MPRPLHAVHHRRVIAVAALGAVGLGSLVAAQRPVPDWELELTLWLNGAPDPLAWAMYPVMQFGSLLGPLAAAAVVAWRLRQSLHAGLIAAAGVATWFAAKAVKELFERGRPAAYLPEIHVREGSGTGLGFISGHAAVAAVTAMCLAPLVRPGRRWLLVAAAGVVGLARIVFGVHLPADVVGGWAFGTLVGLLTLTVATPGAAGSSPTARTA